MATPLDDLAIRVCANGGQPRFDGKTLNYVPAPDGGGAIYEHYIYGGSSAQAAGVGFVLYSSSATPLTGAALLARLSPRQGYPAFYDGGTPAPAVALVYSSTATTITCIYGSGTSVDFDVSLFTDTVRQV